MPRKVYYGSYQSQRNKSNKKKVIIIAVAVIAVIIFVASMCIVSFNEDGYGAAMQASVEEMTQMRIRIKELEDEIINLQNEIEGYKAELAMRPATTAAPIEPPNDAVANMQATPEPTPTPKPRSTRRPSIPTQPPTQPPVSVPETIPEAAPDVTIPEATEPEVSVPETVPAE